MSAAAAPTVWTEGSYNAELGVPLTLGRLEPETEICIVEMGMRGFGQIAELCEIVRPHVGVISAVGPVHLELVGSVDGVARSKAELVEALPPDGIAIVPVSAELEPHLRSDIEILRVPPVDVELREERRVPEVSTDLARPRGKGERAPLRRDRASQHHGIADLD